MPYTPEQLRQKIRADNQNKLVSLMSKIDNEMLKWDGTNSIRVYLGESVNPLVMQELQTKYPGWMITIISDNDPREQGYIITIVEKTKPHIPTPGPSKPWDRYDYPG